MSAHAADPYLDHLLAQMAAYGAQHEEQKGAGILHITQVQVNGNQATVRDCQDESHVALADTRSGETIPHTTGSAHTSYLATLARGTDGRWRLTSLEQLAAPCEPGSSPSL